MNDNIILLTDSYKLSHYKQYPEGTQEVYSYFENRRGGLFSSTVFFGLQYIIKRYLEGRVVTADKLEEARAIADLHVGPGIFNYEGWKYILEEHDGYLPVEIKAVPEGMDVTESNVLMTVRNTDPKCYWLTNYLETLLVQVWYPSTVCTISNAVRSLILDALEETGDPSLVDFKLHDFGYRGVSSVESAGLGGAAHLTNFNGTDTLAGVMLAREYYGAEMAGFSIPASEHSTITSWGKEAEADAYKNMLTAYPTGLVACVSDSYDIEHAINHIWGRDLKEDVLARDGTLVIRPDSGDVVDMVINCLEMAGEAFGTTENYKGYKVLNPKVRIIQGDGCTFNTIEAILDQMKVDNWSADNIAFGMGGGLLQKLDRDTQRFAFKCSHIKTNTGDRDVFKTTLADPSKASKKGKLQLIMVNGRYQTVPEDSANTDLLQRVFLNGVLTRDHSFEAVKHLARNTPYGM